MQYPDFDTAVDHMIWKHGKLDNDDAAKKLANEQTILVAEK